VPDLLLDLLLVRILAELIFEPSVLKLVDTDVGGDSSGQKSVLVEHDQTFDVVGLATENGTYHPAGLVGLSILLEG